jgi:hypothetical protein
MQILWASIAVASALAIVAGTVYIIRGELRECRRRQAFKRLQEAAGDALQGAARQMKESPTYAHFDQDQMLRNRSERWDG